MADHTQWSGSNDWTARCSWSGAQNQWSNGRSKNQWSNGRSKNDWSNGRSRRKSEPDYPRLDTGDSMEDSMKDHIMENSADDQTFESESVPTAASLGGRPGRRRRKGIRQPINPEMKRVLVSVYQPKTDGGLELVTSKVPYFMPISGPEQRRLVGVIEAEGIMPPPRPDAPPTSNDRPKVEAPPPPPVRGISWTIETRFALDAPRAPPPTPLLVNEKMDHFAGAMAYFRPRNMVGALTKALKSSAASLEIGSVGPPPLRLGINSEPLDGSQDYSPEQFIQKLIGLKAHMRQRYLAIHGSCSATSRFGSHVHAGLMAMARQHRPHETNVKALWILYGTHACFNKAQQMNPYGTHQLDGEQCMWFPGTGIYFQNQKGWKGRCIGQEWFGERAWWIDESRVQVCEWTNNDCSDSYSSDVAEIDPPWGDMIVPGLSTQNLWQTAGPSAEASSDKTMVLPSTFSFELLD